MTTSHLTPDILTDYLRGELEPAEDARAHAHVSVCRACRGAMEREAAFTEKIRQAAALERFELPEDLKETIRRKARQTDARPFLRAVAVLRPAFSLPAAAAILIGTLAFPSLMHAIRPEPPTIEATFYLDAHAAQHAAEPFSGRNALPTTSLQTAYTNRVDANDVVR